MKKILFALIAITALSCSNESPIYLKGDAVNFNEGDKIFLQKLEANNKVTPLDTATVTNGKFAFNKKHISQKQLLIINAQGAKSRLLIIDEKDPMQLTLYKDSLNMSVVKGGLENKLFKDYVTNAQETRVERAKLNTELSKIQTGNTTGDQGAIASQMIALDNTTKAHKIELVKENLNSMVSVIVLSDLVNDKAINANEASDLFDKLTDEIKKTSIGKTFSSFIAQSKSNAIAAKLASVGNKAPKFSAPTPEGKQLSLDETLGKYTIIDFWASWCRPCRAENPNVVNVYNKYHKKGLNIISVSLDRNGQAQRWKDAIKNDKMDWYHVSNLQFWQDPIARSYGVRSIPATFLLDKDGVIIAKNLRGSALGNKMKELFGF